MTLQQLRYFCVTAEVLHYTRAASLLYISQPSLSYALSKLEKELNMPLFEKQGKQIALTKYGAEFLPYAKRALAELSKGQERLKELRAPSAGIINLGYIYSVSFSVLPAFVDRFYAHIGSRQTAFRFRQGMAGGLIEHLLNGSLDLLISGKPEIDSIDYLPVASQELFLAVPATHPLAGRDAVRLDEIKNEQFISITHESVIYRELADKFKKVSFSPNIVFEADEYSSIAASVTTGAGVAIMPKLPILDNFNLRLIPFSDVPMIRDVCILRYKLHAMSPAVQQVWEFAKHVSESYRKDGSDAFR
ncbi:MAG: LysR family transcriptional regulator [Clostridia bacterium]|nr:LysR family transcriptional regulator [Clostridia bacterium]